MNAYVYHAELLCGPCAVEIRNMMPEFQCRHGIPRPECEDSDCAPQGPHADGGGKADAPQLCGSCGVFLANPLTSDGYTNLERMLTDGDGDPQVEAEWADFYDFDMSAKKWKYDL